MKKRVLKGEALEALEWQRDNFKRLFTEREVENRELRHQVSDLKAIVAGFQIDNKIIPLYRRIGQQRRELAALNFTVIMWQRLYYAKLKEEK